METEGDAKPKKKTGIESETQEIKQIIWGSNYLSSTKHKLIQIFNSLGQKYGGIPRL